MQTNAAEEVPALCLDRITTNAAVHSAEKTEFVEELHINEPIRVEVLIRFHIFNFGIHAARSPMRLATERWGVRFICLWDSGKKYICEH